MFNNKKFVLQLEFEQPPFIFFLFDIMAFGRDSYWANGEEGAAVACFISGIAVILMGYSVYSHLKSIQDRHVQIRRHSNRSDTKLEDCKKKTTTTYSHLNSH